MPNGQHDSAHLGFVRVPTLALARIGAAKDRRTADPSALHVAAACAECNTSTMAAVSSSVTGGFVDAILARDFWRARGLLHPEIDFRAMTPNRVWEADGPAGAEETLRAWFEHPERDVERVDATEPMSVADTLRVGWRVHGSGAEGPFVYEQQAYLREEGGQVVWLRVMCSGPRPASWPEGDRD